MSATLGAVRNDILGVKKELVKNEEGSTIMFKIRVEQKSVDVAIQEILALHDKLYRDYVQLRETIFIMFKFAGQEDLMKLQNYIELLERYEYGTTLSHFMTQRYLLEGEFELEQIP